MNMMKIDMHLHSSVSDGTDTPAQLLERLRRSSVNLFSLTDHDDCLGCDIISSIRRPDDPVFIPGVELSAEENGRKYHILGYAYDLQSPVLTQLNDRIHRIRMKKVDEYFAYLQNTHHMTFDPEDIDRIKNLPNPGKPHIGNLMIQYGYASSLTEAIQGVLDHHHSDHRDISPEEAVESILAAGGIPVLAHGIYGDGRQYFDETELARRVDYLCDLGLQGMECYYSRYTDRDRALTKDLCLRHGLFATAGSDYHGSNKNVAIADHGLANAEEDPAVMQFLEACQEKLLRHAKRKVSI